MGIRINVNLGWGFTKVKQSDPRFSAEFLKLWEDGDDLLERFKCAVVAAKIGPKVEVDGYDRDTGDAEMLLQRLDGTNWFKEKKPIRSLSVHDVMRQSGYAYEGRRAAPLVFVPIEHDDWKRHDDIIDYYKAGCSPKDKIELVENDGGFPCPIYPYACYVNRRNGKLIPNGSLLAQFRQLDCDWSVPLSEMVSKDMVKKLSEVGITTAEQIRDDIVPEPPFSIRLFCKTFNVFNDPNEVFNLVPMIYTFWD